ncbi:MAG: MarR family transcriptional regulator [Myxococcales bacterium]|nr:MarR family transcriptional regulator [Myxococcales bacterium]
MSLAPTEPYEATLEHAKRASTAQLLFRCARLLNEHALATAPAPAHGPRPRAAHTSLFPHIDLEGTRLTELARRVGVSKQAVGQLVDELEAMGVVERTPDPADGRAKLVRFTTRGRQGLLDGLRHLGAIEAQLAEAIGPARMSALHDALAALDEHLGSL